MPLSTVAWISVVLVQAIVHYVVFGARRARMQHEEELVLGESLSLATNEGEASMDGADESTPLKEALSSRDGGYVGTVVPATPGTPPLLREKVFDGELPKEFFNLLSQTGTEMLKVSSLVKDELICNCKQWG